MNGKETETELLLFQPSKPAISVAGSKEVQEGSAHFKSIPERVKGVQF